jgi:hypothetical protein
MLANVPACRRGVAASLTWSSIVAASMLAMGPTGAVAVPRGSSDGDVPSRLNAEYLVLRHAGPLRLEWQAAVKAAGGELLGVLADDALLVRIAPDGGGANRHASRTSER